MVKKLAHPSLSGDSLVLEIKKTISQFHDERKRPDIPLSDILLSAFAIFSLKLPSLLAIETLKGKEIENVKQVYKFNILPSDTRVREVIDELNPKLFNELFKTVFRQVQRSKKLEDLVFHDGAYLVAMDGTGYFLSKSVKCKNCLVKKNKKTGEEFYHHQMLGAVLMHPDYKQVIPLAPEPIIKQDGALKNDCERNAAKRLLPNIKKAHPHLKMIITEDSLSSNGPHIRTIVENGMGFILGAKPRDHKYLFDEANLSPDKKYYKIRTDDGFTHEFEYVNTLPINQANEDLKVNFLHYKQTNKKGKITSWSWVTNIELTEDTVYKVMRGGRARWRIENETFNTLKNQGYQFEHNYGHGYKNLSTNFASLMMLAFAVDQVQELACRLYQETRKGIGTKAFFFEKFRAYILTPLFNFKTFTDILAFMLNGETAPLLRDTS